MSAALHPQDGARFLLERVGAGTPAEAAYAATIYTPTEAFAYRARLAADGEVTLEPIAAAAPAALEDALRMFARLTARGAPARAADGLGAWPARVLRWRPPRAP
ncbi:MAG: hypothetical protein R2939_17615 [Kofleriaceae bacterium]